MFGTSRGLSRWCSTLALDMKPHRCLIIKTQTVPLYFDVLSPSLKWFLSIAWIRDFDISVSLDLGMKGIGSGQRTIARFEKSPTWSSGTSRLFWWANAFFAHIIWPMCKGFGGGVVVLKYMYGLYGYLPLNLECFFPLWLWNRVYKTTRYLWKKGIPVFYFILNPEQGRFIVN